MVRSTTNKKKVHVGVAKKTTKRSEENTILRSNRDQIAVYGMCGCRMAEALGTPIWTKILNESETRTQASSGRRVRQVR